MNFTLFALSCKLLSNSPMFNPSSYATKSSYLVINNFNMHHFFNNFILDASNHVNTSIISSSFINFMNTPISIENRKDVIFQSIIQNEVSRYYDIETLEIVKCIFLNCHADNGEDKTYFRGGAIRYESKDNANGYLTVYGTTFENCWTPNGDGGAIFACKRELETGYNSNHEMTNFFNSSYCCYSKCSAKYKEMNQKAGYGSVMFIFANDVEVFYSTAVDCPNEGKSYGAQFDLKSKSIQSSYINSTRGSSEYCIAMEYRDADVGTFKYQSFFELSGGYISSFTDLKDNRIDMSFCNFVNDNLQNLEFNRFGSIIYVRNCDVHFSHFCFVDIKYDRNFDVVHFEGDGQHQTVTLSDCVIESSMINLLSRITTINVIFYEEGKTKFTNTIPLLGLGPCEGEVTPPPTIASNVFTKSSFFSNSNNFLETEKFSNSDEFSGSKRFAETNEFSKSDEFSGSKGFVKTNEFSESNKFSKSDEFSVSKRFVETNEFSKSNEFSDSDELLSRIDINTITKSKVFTESKKFTHSNHFSKSFEFSDSETWLENDNGNAGQDDGKNKGLPTGAIVGIAVAAAVVVAAIVIFFVIRAKRKHIDLEEADMGNNETQTITTANPLYGKNEDDPFKEDFDDGNRDSTAL